MNALALKLHRELVMADKEANAIPTTGIKDTIAYSIHRMQDAQYLASLLEFDKEMAEIEFDADYFQAPESLKTKVFDIAEKWLNPMNNKPAEPLEGCGDKYY